MKMQIRNQPNFYSGLLFFAVGLGFNTYSFSYDFGSAVQMGPAYFPFVVGGLLAIIGLVILLQSLQPNQKPVRISSFPLRPILLVLGSVAAFAALLMHVGLIAASFAMIVISSAAAGSIRWVILIPLAAILILACYLVFILGLGLFIPVWGGE